MFLIVKKLIFKLDPINILGQTLGLNVSILFLMPPILQTSDLERSDQNCHFKYDNYILITRMPMPEVLTGGAFSIRPTDQLLIYFHDKQSMEVVDICG